MCPRSKKIFLTQAWGWVKIGFQGEVATECILKDNKAWTYSETETFLIQTSGKRKERESVIRDLY